MGINFLFDRRTLFSKSCFLMIGSFFVCSSKNHIALQTPRCCFLPVIRLISGSVKAGIKHQSKKLEKKHESQLKMSENPKDFTDDLNLEATKTLINWYPGHIAKAESQLKDYLKMVDVVIECRDARILHSTTHPLVPDWLGKRPHIVVINRADTVNSACVSTWRSYLTKERSKDDKIRPIFFVDAKRGAGIHQVKRAVLKAGAFVNERRERRGIQPRAIRAAVIGYPNVGKSALINRLIGRAVAKSQNIPGVTRTLNWHRIGRNQQDGGKASELELLDSPGIIPAKQVSQETAVKLAICNDIGQASYDVQVVAARMIDLIASLHVTNPITTPIKMIEERYKVKLHGHSGESYLYEIAQKHYNGIAQSAADKLLADFRKGLLGLISLEVPLVDEIVEDNENTSNIMTSKPKKSMKPQLERFGAEGSVFIGKGDFEGW